MRRLYAHDSRDAAAAALGERIADHLRAGIDKRGRATLAVCGGSSPLDLFARLREVPLDWARVTVVATDERWVAPENEQSNEGIIRRELLSGPAAPAALISLYVGDRDPAAALPVISQRLERIAGPFDAVVLGMGEDGHTASLFPDATNIRPMLASRAACVVPQFADARTPRISLGPARLLAARAAYLLFFGDAKRRVYDRAEEAGPPADYPVRFMLHQQRTPLSIFWAH